MRKIQVSIFQRVLEGLRSLAWRQNPQLLKQTHRYLWKTHSLLSFWITQIFKKRLISERLRGRKEAKYSTCQFTLQVIISRLDQAKVRSHKFHPGLLHEWQGHKHLSHILLLSQAISKNLEQLGYEPAPTRDASIKSSGFIHCVTMSVLIFFFQKIFLFWGPAQ